MNETEIARIAASVNALRPDWPIASIVTLLKRPELLNRARRDVAVALAWVACESETKTPARVLGAGPWWHAATADGGQPLTRFEDGCDVCGQPETVCVFTQPRYEPEDQHEFISVETARRLRHIQAGVLAPDDKRWIGTGPPKAHDPRRQKPDPKETESEESASE